MKPSLVLASGSFSRQEMLRHAGYVFDVMPADIDEEKLSKNVKNEDVALFLAGQKASHVSQHCSDSYVIGSDQVLIMNEKIYSKAKNKNEAKQRLTELQGQAHVLISAVSVYKNNEELFSFEDKATLTMKPLNNDEIVSYCKKAGDILTSCVGCYALESLGSRLFERIEGDYFTILGMPLLPLIGFLDQEGFKL